VVHSPNEPSVSDINYENVGPDHTFAIMSKLVNLDYHTGAIIPDLAERWDVSQDGKVYTFYLARNVKFHDGHSCTSADVKWTIESILKEKGYYAAQLSGIDKIEAPDDNTVKITLKQVDPSFMATMAIYYSPVILPKHLYEGTDVRKNPLEKKPIGTGPFKLQEWAEGSHMVLVRNDDYFKGRPYLEKVVIRFSQSWAVVLSAWRSGEIHMSMDYPPYAEVAVLEKVPEIQVAKMPGSSIMHVDFNLNRKPFSDLKVRQALAAAMDVDDINRKVYAGYCTPFLGMYMPSVEWAYNPNAKQPSYDPQKAEQLLDEAGYKRGSDGIRFKMKFDAANEMQMPALGEVLREQYRKIGVDVSLEVTDWGMFADRVFTKKDFDMAVSGGAIFPDPNLLARYIGAGQSRNCMGYSNPRIEELLKMGRAEVNQAERKKIYFEVQEILARDLPRLSVVGWVNVHPFRKEFQGFWFQSEFGKTALWKSYGTVWWTAAPPPKPTVTTSTTTTVKPVEEFPTSAILIGAVVVALAIGVYYWNRKGKSKASSRT